MVDVIVLPSTGPGYPGRTRFLYQGASFYFGEQFFSHMITIYHQIKGTAMGARVERSNANLFMGLFEQQNIYSGHPFLNNLILYDDLFFV